MLDCPTGSITNINAAVLVSFDLGGSDYAGSGKVDDLEQRLQCRVLDRTNLILDIFAQRAKSHEGKLQVKLTRLEHLATHLVRDRTHLERQKNGIGLRDPGETQLETDRQLLRKRVKSLRGKLARLQRQHKVQRRARQRAQVMSASIVGWTNQVNLPLFNVFTRARVHVVDQLFAALDATHVQAVHPRARALGDFRYSGFHSRIATYAGRRIPCYSGKNNTSQHVAACSGCRQPQSE